MWTYDEAKSFYEANFPTDEPARTPREDALGRTEVSRELARIALCCETPMVIGIYGPWGSGKSSFMEFIRHAIEKDRKTLFRENKPPAKVRIVKFNPWEAQFTEEPAVALLKNIARVCDVHTNADKMARIGSMMSFTRKGLGVAATLAAAAAVVNPIAEILKYTFKNAESVVKDNIPDNKTQNSGSLDIQEEFRTIIETATKEHRLIIFIDDLDRCSHEQTLRLMEALKLYLNHRNCVYLIGADPEAIKASIEHHYRDSRVAIKGEDYLDKIIQIPFKLPGVSRNHKEGFVSNLLGADLKSCSELMMAGLGDSPRNLKRFSLLLKMNYLAGKTHSGYKPEPAALFQLIQWISDENKKGNGHDLFSLIAKDRREMLRLVEQSDEGEKKRREVLGEDNRLTRLFRIAMESANVPRDIAEVDLYIHLARQVGGSEEEIDDVVREVNLKNVIDQHKEWLLSGGVRGKRANLMREQCAKEDLKRKGEKLRDVNLARAYLYGIFMEYSNLEGAILYDAVLEEAALSGINLSKADLRRANLKGADLKGACMRESDLRLANLARADLSRDKRRNADLSNAKLCGADLKGANLENANLTKADLTNANLLGANLTGAILTDCILKGAYLAEVKGLEIAQFKSAYCTEQCTHHLDI